MQIKSLNLTSEDSENKPLEKARAGFFKRQFLLEADPKPRLFDWSYGVGIPLVCAAADPFVFRNDGLLLLQAYQPFAYLLSSVSILTMAAWLLWRGRLGWLSAPIAGLFLTGSAVCLIVGLVLFPLSLMGLSYGIPIAILGFTPLISGFVFLRAGVLAFRESKAFLEPAVAWHVTGLAAIFSAVIPYVVNLQFSTWEDMSRLP